MLIFKMCCNFKEVRKIWKYWNIIINNNSPANPINTPKPKQAKNAINTITNSPLCIEYILI